MKLVIKRFYYFTTTEEKEKFHSLLDMHNITVRELAEMYGCTRTHMYAVINGIKPVNRNLYDFLCIVFNNDPMFLHLFDFEVL